MSARGLLLVAVAAGLAGCGDGSGPPPPQASSLHVLHAIRGGPSLTVSVDGARGSTQGRENGEPREAALVCHPHPQHGGTMHNKVVYRIARGLRETKSWRAVLSRDIFRNVVSVRELQIYVIEGIKEFGAKL